MSDTTNKRIRTVGKILGTFGIVAGMALGFSWYGQGGDFFGDAGADIVTSSFAPKTKQAKFVDSLQEYGFSQPRMYDYDGNTVFFSTKTTRKSPSIAAREMQEIFHKNGVNDRVYNGIPQFYLDPEDKDDPEAFEKAMGGYEHLMSGQMVPVKWERNSVAMGGLEMEGNPDSLEVLEAFTKGRNILEGVKRVRYVDAFRSEPTEKTSMTATWSDGDLDFDKFASNSRPDRTVPACPGCDRIRRFGGSGEESPYVENVFATNHPPEKMRKFYREALKARGWELSEASALLSVMEEMGFKESDRGKRFDAYARAGVFLHVLTYVDPASGQTRVHVMRGP